jgi:hypothetical protein
LLPAPVDWEAVERVAEPAATTVLLEPSIPEVAAVVVDLTIADQGAAALAGLALLF